MSVTDGIISGCALLVPARHRARYREEWLADLQYAEGLGLSPSSVVRGAVRATLLLQRKRFMMADILTRQLAKRGIIEVVTSLVFLVVGAAIGASRSTIQWSIWVIALTLGFVGMARLAGAATRLTRTRNLPWTLYTTLGICALALSAGVVEVNLNFNANDSGHPSTIIQTAMFVTGIIGTTAFATALVLASVLASRGLRGQYKH